MEVVKNKITSEELEGLKAKVEAVNNAQMQIGGLEAHKHELLHTISGLANELREIQKGLEDTYGSVNIDLATGEITEIADVTDNTEN